MSCNAIEEKRERINWWLPVYTAISASVTLLLLFVFTSSGDLLYTLLIAPLICVVFLVVLVASANRKRPRRSLSILFALITFIVVSGAMLKSEASLRPGLRWALLSHHLKAEVLAQPAPANGELKHVEWDGWGGTPIGDWTAYVVFDPTDSLSAPAKSNSSGRFRGIPCDVEAVRRLENDWYSVTLGMNEWWDRCG